MRSQEDVPYDLHLLSRPPHARAVGSDILGRSIFKYALYLVI